MEFDTIINHGTIAIPSNIRKELLDMTGTKVMVSVKKYRNMRSKRQNRYYWGVVVKTIQAYSKDILGEEYTKEEVHLYLVHNILGRIPEVTVVMGDHILTYKDVETSKMSTEEFGEYIMKIQKHFAELDIDIPDPDPHYGFNLPSGA